MASWQILQCLCGGIFPDPAMLPKCERMLEPVLAAVGEGRDERTHDIGLVEPAGDVAAKRSAQHARAAR